MSTLYLVTGETEDGENLDLFIEAENHHEAAAWWADEWRDSGVSEDNIRNIWPVPEKTGRGPRVFRWFEDIRPEA